MPIRAKYHANQKLLGSFVDGMPEPTVIPDSKPSVVDEHQDSIAQRSKDYVVHRKESDGEYAYNDMINMAVPVVWTIKGHRVIVCPRCKKDVEPVFSKPTGHAIDKIASFARCEVCDIQYFICELVAQRSFRLVLPKEDISSYHPYLSLEFFKGNWCVLTADLVS